MKYRQGNDNINQIKDTYLVNTDMENFARNRFS